MSSRTHIYQFFRINSEKLISCFVAVNGGEKNWLTDLGCEVRAVEEILAPVDGCPSQMESVEFGYVNPLKEKSLILGEACTAVDVGRTVFIHVKIGDPVSRQIAHLRTEDKDYLKKNHPTSKYKIDLLMAARMDELNERLGAKLGTSNVPFLETRHFIDAITLQNKQFASIMKLGWNFVVANGYDRLPNWDLLQEDVMKITTGGRTFDLYMGTIGVLSLPGADSKKNEIYLRDEEKRFPVAKYVWLVVIGDDAAAAFVVLNSDGISPAGNDTDDDEICQSKCDQMPWLKNLAKDNAYTKVSKGKVWCCDLASFTQKVSDLPKLDENLSLLI